jgi:hypothetical protein
MKATHNLECRERPSLSWRKARKERRATHILQDKEEAMTISQE